MTWTRYHGESERLATEAQLARGQREFERAERLYEEAGDRERLAFDSLDASKARTRGITGVSAVALWFKARAYAKSEQFAHALLADLSMPAFAREDLRVLLQWIEAAKQMAGVRLPGQVMVSVKGGEGTLTGPRRKKHLRMKPSPSSPPASSPSPQTGEAMRGKCHICKTVTEVTYCSACGHYFCADCRGKYWARGIAFVRQLIGGATPGCCGSVEEKRKYDL